MYSCCRGMLTWIEDQRRVVLLMAAWGIDMRAMLTIVFSCLLPSIAHAQLSQTKPDYLRPCKNFHLESKDAWSCLYRNLTPMFRTVCGEARDLEYYKCVDRIRAEAAKIACAPGTAFRYCADKFFAYVWEIAQKEAEEQRAAWAREDQERLRLRQQAISRLPSWRSGQSPEVRFLNKRDTPELKPAEVFRAVEPSVYIVMAGENLDAIYAGKGIRGSAVAVSTTVALTNCHVIKGQLTIVLHHAVERTNAGARLRATPLKADVETDRCLLTVEGLLDPISFIRRMEDVQVGERVYTIGNPMGLSNTLGDGLVSGVRQRQGITLVQTSAPVSSGSSGGALVDAYGSLIGITTFLVKDAQNLNFAIAAEEFWR